MGRPRRATDPPQPGAAAHPPRRTSTRRPRSAAAHSPRSAAALSPRRTAALPPRRTAAHPPHKAVPAPPSRRPRRSSSDRAPAFPTPATPAALAAPQRCPRPPGTASGPLAGPPERRAPGAAAPRVPPRPARPGRRSAPPPPAAPDPRRPSASPVRTRTTAGPDRSRRGDRSHGRSCRADGGAAGPPGTRPRSRSEGHRTCQAQPPEGHAGYAECQNECKEWRKRGVWGVPGGARLFARSGGNGGVRHGPEVPTGKTSLVGGGATRKRPSHVRHRRTGEWGICLACGNIVSHHRVGADVGVRGQEAVLVLGPVSAVGMSGPRLRD